MTSFAAPRFAQDRLSTEIEQRRLSCALSNGVAIARLLLCRRRRGESRPAAVADEPSRRAAGLFLRLGTVGPFALRTGWNRRWWGHGLSILPGDGRSRLSEISVFRPDERDWAPGLVGSRSRSGNSRPDRRFRCRRIAPPVGTDTAAWCGRPRLPTYVTP
jgi:hypothetical protein